MTSTDSVKSMIDMLDAKLNLLLQEAQRSSSIANLISLTYQNLRDMDHEINTIKSKICQTTTWVQTLTSLDEKSAYLDVMISTGDYTSGMSLLSALSTEHQKLNDAIALAPKLIENYHELSAYHAVLNPPDFPTLGDASDNLLNTRLKMMSSLSELKLKPIRCKSKQLCKKKSRYRISGVFNANPITLGENSPRNEQVSPNSFELGYASNSLEDKTNDQNRTAQLLQDTHTTNPFIKKHEPVGLQTLGQLNSFDSFMTPTDFTYTGTRSISCSTEFTDEILELADKACCINSECEEHPNLYQHSISLPCSIKQKLGCSFVNDVEKNDEELAESRTLRHFVSFPNFPAISKKPGLDSEQNSTLSATFGDEKVEDAFKDSIVDFSSYLRHEQNERKPSFPPLVRSMSQESIFDKSRPTAKFHNPADKLRPTIRVPLPTLDEVHRPPTNSTSIRQHLDSKALLNNVMLRDTAPVIPVPMTAPSTPTRVIPISIPVRALQSPKLSLRKINESFGMSFTHNVLNFLSQSPLKANDTDQAKCVKFETPQTPIHALNLNNERRKPSNTPRTDGAHSQLTIGPGLVRIIQHGDSLIFKRLQQSRLSSNTFEEAIQQEFD